ncbi:MAG: 30S ribosomal protein S7 [bacterium]
MRGKKAPKRVIAPDPLYGDVLLSRFINMVMLDGKKSTAQTIVYGALDDALHKLNKPNLKQIEIFTKVMTTLKPAVRLRSRRVGGANLQIPVPLTDDQANFLVMKWLIDAARARKGMDMYLRLSAEFVDAFNNTGTAFRKKEEMHKMAEANKAYSHFNW